MPVRDGAHVLRDGTALLNEAAHPETTTGVHVGEGPIGGMKLSIYVPLDAAAATLNIHLEEGETLGGTYYDVPGGAVPEIDAVGYFEHHVSWSMPYLRLVSAIVGAGADFGYTTVNLTPGRIETT